jgi:hypothetical protein
VWLPSHFRAELTQTEQKVRAIKARHVIWCTVPHVTIAPIARGVSDKVTPGSRYYPYYTRPWITNTEFDPTRHPYLTADEARAIDATIDQYNEAIVALVKSARQNGRDWYLLDTAGILDELASRRYLEDTNARPPWWRAYQLPPPLAALAPPPDSKFLASDGTKRIQGGLFSLDGVHPTTVGYGILAQELINIMRLAGVQFRRPDNLTPRPDPVIVDFDRLIRRDSLITKPPGNVALDLSIYRWADEVASLMKYLSFRPQ